MKLSIIVPAHNEEQYIGKCLSSLLNQTYKDYEIIVVNDGSTDRTEAIVKELQKKSKKIKLISFKEGHSAAFARNRGAEKAKGGILVFIDADQFVKKDFLNRIAKNFENKKIDAHSQEKFLEQAKHLSENALLQEKWYIGLQDRQKNRFQMNFLSLEFLQSEKRFFLN
jgi:cellulose synthase/poly-beta-1,6-N-acetylglucosamine synthase-like glycosyltransferase